MTHRKVQWKKENPKKFMTKAFGRMEKGMLHSKLRVPKNNILPREFLEEIKDTPIGLMAMNPTNIGIKSVEVTLDLKRAVVPILIARAARLKKAVHK